MGWGGNNGTTVTAAVLANRLGLSWMTKTGRKVGVPSEVSVPIVTSVRGFPPGSPLQGGCCPQCDPYRRDPSEVGVPRVT